MALNIRKPYYYLLHNEIHKVTFLCKQGSKRILSPGLFQNYKLLVTFKKMSLLPADDSGLCVESKLDLYDGASNDISHLISGNKCVEHF